ncbi:MAG: hypothetical protein L6437_15875, partial [Kiritimatiellae bacterium]|nr:hypothetical protein [Kiritimatiellia bacterium]
VIEMDVSSADKAFIVQALLWNIYAHCAGRQEGNAGLTNLIVLEEAHNILRKNVASAKETIPEILLRQARSRGIGLVVVDQTISLLSPAVLGNIHNLICLSQPPSGTAMKMLNLPEDGKDYTGRLEVGEAIVKLQSNFQAPFTLRFPLEPCKEQFVTDAEIRAHMSTFHANPDMEYPGIPDADISPDIPTTDKKDELSEKEKELLKSIWMEPYNSTVKKYQRLGVSRRQGQKLRQGLIAKGLIKKVPCMIPEGQVVLMEITAKGRKILGEIGIDTSKYNPREGGAVHRYWVERMAKKYRERGYQVEKEVAVGDRIIDVVATSPEGKRIGIEIIRKGDSCDVVKEEL